MRGLLIATTTGLPLAFASLASAEGSETPDGSVVIPALPFADTGNTSDKVNDHDIVCPYAGSTAPDVFYAFTPGANVLIDVVSCESGHDSKTNVLDSALASIACDGIDEPEPCGESKNAGCDAPTI